MKTLFPILGRMGVLCAALLAMPSGRADALTWNSSTAGGTWDFNTTASWNDGSGAVKWTDNTDQAIINLNATGSSAINIDDGAGQVGAYGLALSGTVGTTSQTLTLGNTGAGGVLQLGAGGLAVNITTPTNKLLISAPIQLTASQTWSTTTNTTTDTGGISGVVGTTTNLIFDTRGASASSTITLQGASTYTGSTTLRGGGTLVLDYNASNNTPKLDSFSALVLAGGTLKLTPNATAAFTQSVASTLVAAGSTSISRPSATSSPPGTNITLQLGTISRNVGTGATLDISPGNGTSTILTDSHNDATGILGAWATYNGSNWAVSAASGTNIAIGAAASGTGITNRASSSVWGGSTENVNDNASTSETGITSHTINTLRIQNANVGVGLASGATLTLAGGGLLAGNTGQSLTGGSVTTGLASGELFVQTPNAFSIGSAIVDNGTAVSLVKAGTNTLTLTGSNTYSGTTYVNAGNLTIGAGGSIASSGRVVVMAGATFDSSAIGGHTVGSGKILSGGGTVVGNVVVSSGGRIAPTVSYVDASGVTQLETGILKFSNNLTFNDGSALTFDLGTNSDLISLTNVTGATLTGSASMGGISLTFNDAGGIAVGNTYTLMQWTGATTLNNFVATDFTINGLNGITGTLAIDSVNDKLTFTVSAVPEPSTVGFALFGLLSLVFLVRRRLPGKAAA